MDPMVEAAQAALEQLQHDLRDGLAGQPASVLNWRPYPEGNSITGLAAHMVESANFVLHAGLGTTLPRERDIQFSAEATDDATLLAQFDAGMERVLSLLQRYTPADLAAQHDFRGTMQTGAWFIMRVCNHLHEHWGQIQTNRDLANAH